MRPASRQRYFVTGTDTGIGKTTVCVALLQRAVQQGWRCVGIKPVSSGCIEQDGHWLSEDGQLLLAAGSVPLSHEQIAPVRLPLPASPHLAALAADTRLTLERLTGLVRGAVSEAGADCILIEGAGGWLTPINARQTLADLAVQLQYPVILVVGLRLGCINHALLTAQAIRQSGLTLAGFVVNTLADTGLMPQQQIETLIQRLDAPCLGVLPWQADLAAESAGLGDCLRWPCEPVE